MLKRIALTIKIKRPNCFNIKPSFSLLQKPIVIIDTVRQISPINIRMKVNHVNNGCSWEQSATVFLNGLMLLFVKASEFPHVRDPLGSIVVVSTTLFWVVVSDLPHVHESLSIAKQLTENKLVAIIITTAIAKTIDILLFICLFLLNIQVLQSQLPSRLLEMEILCNMRYSSPSALQNGLP